MAPERLSPRWFQVWLINKNRIIFQQQYIYYILYGQVTILFKHILAKNFICADLWQIIQLRFHAGKQLISETNYIHCTLVNGNIYRHIYLRWLCFPTSSLATPHMYIWGNMCWPFLLITFFFLNFANDDEDRHEATQPTTSFRQL